MIRKKRNRQLWQPTVASTGWSESQNRASVYTFNNALLTNGSPQISTNPTSGLSNARTDNRALYLPEPRIGLAWDAFGNGRTSVTASAGLHHSLLDALDYRLVATDHQAVALSQTPHASAGA